MKNAVSNQGSLVIVSGQDSRSDPCISSVCNCHHDYYFELLGEEERDGQSIARCSTAHHGDFRAVPRADRTFLPARSPIPCASSRTAEWLTCGPSLPSQSSARVASPSENTYCAI